MEEKKLTLKEIFERIQYMFGYDMETEKVTEFIMRSLVNDVFNTDIFENAEDSRLTEILEANGFGINER